MVPSATGRGSSTGAIARKFILTSTTISAAGGRGNATSAPLGRKIPILAAGIVQPSGRGNSTGTTGTLNHIEDRITGLFTGVGTSRGTIGRLIPLVIPAGTRGTGTAPSPAAFTITLLHGLQIVPSAGRGNATGSAREVITLNSSYISADGQRGRGNSAGAIARQFIIATTAATSGRGTAAGTIGRLIPINAAKIVAGTSGRGTSTGRTGQLNNIDAQLTALNTGKGSSSGALRVTHQIVAAAVGTVSGRGNATGAAARRIFLSASSFVQSAGRGNSAGAIRRLRAVPAQASGGRGNSAGAVSVSGVTTIVNADISQPAGRGNSTGAIKRLADVRGSSRGVGNSAGAATRNHPVTIVFAQLGQGGGRGDAAITSDGFILVRGIGTEDAASARGTGTSAVAADGIRIYKVLIAASFTATKGTGTATGAILRLADVRGSSRGTGTSAGAAAPSTIKQILAANVVLTLGTGAAEASSTALREVHSLAAAARGTGTSFIPVGGFLISGSAPIWAPGMRDGYITQFDPAWFHPAVVHTYTALFSWTGGDPAKSRLYNVTDDVPVAGSEVTISTFMNTLIEVESGALTFPAGVKDYRAEVRTDGRAGTFDRGRIAHTSS